MVAKRGGGGVQGSRPLPVEKSLGSQRLRDQVSVLGLRGLAGKYRSKIIGHSRTYLQALGLRSRS